jgi:hypothetical protein
MGIGVVRDRVAVDNLAARDLWQALRTTADVKKGGANTLLRERIEDPRSRPGVGSVVEGEDDFVIGERDRPRIGLEADLAIV